MVTSLEYFSRYKEQKIKWDFWASFVRKRIKKKGKILEVGCAYAYLLKRLENDYKTFGIDISEHAIKQASKVTKKSRLFVTDAEKLGIKEKDFDIIFCLDVLEHLKNPNSSLKRCKELLKKGGYLIISVPNIHSLLKWTKGKKWFGYQDKTHFSLLPPKKWKKLLKDNNFKIQKRFTDGFFDIPYVPLIPKHIQKIFLIPGWLQYKLKFGFLKFGENLIFICKKD